MREFVDRHHARGATWGRIVTMTSGTGGAFPGQVSYGAAKSALTSYTLSAVVWLCADANHLVTGNVVRLR